MKEKLFVEKNFLIDFLIFHVLSLSDLNSYSDVQICIGLAS